MKIDKNTVIGLILMAAVMFGFMWYQSTTARKRQAQLQAQAHTEAIAQQKSDSIKNIEDEKQAKKVQEELKKLTLKMLNFTMRDEKIIMMRKLLLTEQFHDERIRELATEHFNIGLESMFTVIFEGRIKNAIKNAANCNSCRSMNRFSLSSQQV